MHHELILQVLTLDDRPVPAEPIRFEPLGGTIGRAPECTMVLADESRSVSRVHAHIRFSNGAFEFQQTADNFSQLNGRTVDPLVPVVLADGDLLSIGLFLIEVREAASAAREALLGKTNLFIKPSLVTAAAASSAPSPAPSSLPPALDAFLQPRHVNPAIPQRAHGADRALLPSSGFSAAQTTIPDDYDFTADAGPVDSARAVTQRLASRLASRQASTITTAITPTIRSTSMPSAAVSSGGAVNASSAAALDATGDAASNRPPHAPENATSDACFAALLEGLGVANDGRFATLDPRAFALLAGQMLRASLGSAIDVLRSRAIVKREAGMEATMIVARENNPLKFFPDVDAALPVMLGNRPGAYLPPVQAIQEAFADIHTHELGMLAGISASLADQLLQLDPDEISDAATPSAMQRLFGKQKVAAWDVFVERQAMLRTALDESAGALSSEAFRGAYQAQVDGHPSIKGSVYRVAK